MASLGRLPEALRDYGLKVSVEWQPGRPGVGGDGFVGTMGHHTAGRWKRNGNVLLTPSLAIVKRGRPDLPGPLCNGYLGRDLVARCITKGGANHPGKGGPYVVPGYRIPADSARPYLAGWEFEHDGGGEPWTDEFLDACARCLAATLDCLGRDSRSHLEHKTWAPGRKSDRNAISLAQARAQIDRARAAHRKPRPAQEDDVTPQDMEKIADLVVEKLLKTDLGKPGGGDTVAVALQSGLANTKAIRQKLGA